MKPRLSGKLSGYVMTEDFEMLLVKISISAKIESYGKRRREGYH